MSILSVVKEKAQEAVEGAKNVAIKGAKKAAGGVAKMAVLSPYEVEAIDAQRREYLEEKRNDKDTAKEAVSRSLQSIAIEVTQTYLPRLDSIYLPVRWENESFSVENRIRYFDVTKWVVDSSEKSLDKLTNLYQVLSKEDCSVALIYTRRMDGCSVTLAVANLGESDQPYIAHNLCERLRQALQGNFPGVELPPQSKAGTPVPLQNASSTDTLVAVSNLASERSEDFVSQSIEKLLDGVVPKSKEEEYTVVLLAQPSFNLEARRDRIYELYSVLSPYATWQESSSTNESLTKTASASVGLQLGAHWGKQFGTNVGGHAGVGGVGVNVNASQGTNFGFSIGGSFQRASTSSETIGKTDGTTRSYTNYGIKHTLELLENQVKRLEECMALGMWEFGAYVISRDYNTASNVANMYLSLTQGEKSYLEQAAINVWSSQIQGSASIENIIPWLQALQHPEFALSPGWTEINPDLQVFPTLATAATAISGDELAHALNFPRKSVGGLPVYECVPFGRAVVQYDKSQGKPSVLLGKIVHMRQVGNTEVSLDKDSLTSHTFITGSTGAGKSNTIYTLLDKLCLSSDEQTHFLIIEPAKGEYRDALGGYPGVSVYGTNPYKAPILRLNPFSFPEDTHVLEHIDRLVEVFNACWPMYAAMPAVLKASVELAYENCGWNLASSTCFTGSRNFPTFRDVRSALPDVVNSKGFSKDTQGDYTGALLTRLESLTNGINGQVLCAKDELPDGELFDRNVIVDLSRVGSSETKALLMGILVLKLQEHRMAQRAAGANRSNSGLQHITVLEEAHNLLRRTSTEQSQESSNLQGKSVEMLTNAIAEMRTYGEGFIIADQAPGLLDMAAIRNTNTKIVLRLPDEGDRVLIGRAAGLNDDQIVELSRLDTGVAAVYQNHWLEPVLCKVEHFSDEKSFAYEYKPSNESDGAIHKYLMRLFALSDDKELSEEDVDVVSRWIASVDQPMQTKSLMHKSLKCGQLPEKDQEIVAYSLFKGRQLAKSLVKYMDEKEGVKHLDTWLLQMDGVQNEELAIHLRQLILRGVIESSGVESLNRFSTYITEGRVL